MIKLGQFDVNYRPCTMIKGHALADFIVEFTYFDTTKVASTIDNAEEAKGVEMEKGRTFITESEDNSDNTE